MRQQDERAVKRAIGRTATETRSDIDATRSENDAVKKECDAAALCPVFGEENTEQIPSPPSSGERVRVRGCCR
jgi:hypothetical protein